MAGVAAQHAVDENGAIFNSAIRTDFAIRGFAISFLKLPRVAFRLLSYSACALLTFAMKVAPFHIALAHKSIRSRPS
jgi:hypothetical protein